MLYSVHIMLQQQVCVIPSSLVNSVNPNPLGELQFTPVASRWHISPLSAGAPS